MQNITDNNFKEIISSKKPVLVDFWAPWCGPCKMLSPILEKLATEFGEKVDIVKLNVDENPQTASNYNISSIPTMLIFKEGEIIGQKVGSGSLGELKKWIEESI